VPSPFVGNEPPYTNIRAFNQPKGTVSPAEPWLSFNRFLARDVLGAYNKQITDAVIEANQEARLGPIPGGMQWPVFSSPTGQYPPMNFGANGFNMISYYMYLNYWRPAIGYVYWTELARAGNRGLPTYVMPDALFPEESYLWNNFYLILAAGVDGISYFLDGDASAEFWKVSKDKIGPLAERFGPLWARLEPKGRKVGLLVAFTTGTYRNTAPLRSLCAYANLLMAHVDVEPIVEEEILSGQYFQYDAVVLEDVDWLRSDVIDVLTRDAGGPLVVLDGDTEVPLVGNRVRTLNLNLVEGGCAANPDYGKPDRLNQIRTKMAEFVNPDVQVDSETMIYRKFTSGDATYLWLVNVHSRDEYVSLFEKMQQGGYSDAKVLSQMVSYLNDRGVYGGMQSAHVGFRTASPVVALDVIGGKTLPISSLNGWTTFDVSLPRLAGTLIALYPAVPSALQVEIPDRLLGGQPARLKIQVTSVGGPIKAAFPL
jgi:hypothetical protein